MVEAIERVVTTTGAPAPKQTRFPWWMLPLAAPFMPTLRELREMRYLWREPLRMPNAALVAELGEEPHTPIDTAIETTLRSLGCVDR